MWKLFVVNEDPNTVKIFVTTNVIRYLTHLHQVELNMEILIKANKSKVAKAKAVETSDKEKRIDVLFPLREIMQVHDIYLVI